MRFGISMRGEMACGQRQRPKEEFLFCRRISTRRLVSTHFAHRQRFTGCSGEACHRSNSRAPERRLTHLQAPSCHKADVAVIEGRCEETGEAGGPVLRIR
jgi:hypothetical protein